MEDYCTTTTHKRKFAEICDQPEEERSSRFPLEELNLDLLERVLSWLPTSSFLRLTSVCKRWKSTADSATFRRACSQVPSRDPWFFMVASQPQPTHHPIAFDSAEGNWKSLNHPPLLHALNHNKNPCSDFIPVAASGGLICYHRADGGDFIITNPITGSSRQISSPFPIPQKPILAIAMMSKAELFVVYGDLPNLKFRRYNSGVGEWEEETALTRRINNPIGDSAKNEDCTQYFLSKCGNVVSTDIQRSPSKQYSSVLALKDEEEILYFLSSSGKIVACNLTRRFFFEYPRLLPVHSEYSIDLVECGGNMYVVLLCEFLETCSVRVWTWHDGVQCWRQIAAMPAYMSHKWYGKKVDINCTGAGEKMLVCVNSEEVCCYMMCDLGVNEWVELPQWCEDGEAKEFVCGFSFEPRIEASA